MLYSENIHFTKNGINFTDKDGRKLRVNTAVKKGLKRVSNWFLDMKLYGVHFVSLYFPFWSIRRFVFKIAGVKIDRNSIIHMCCKFFDPNGVNIGRDTIVGERAFLDGRAPIIMGDHVDIASEVMIYNSEHDINSPSFKAINGMVKISDYVFIGPRAIILPGVKIGTGAVVAAGAVVTKNVRDFSIVAGVPAKEIGERKLKNPKYSLGRARLFQ